MVKSRSKRGKGSVKAMEDPKPFCKLVTKKFLEEHLEEYKEWVREPRYVCKKCGMVARREKDLCKPVPIGPRPEECSPAPGEGS